MSEELSEMLHTEILNVSEQAENLFEEEQYDSAIKLYEEAVELLPDPKTAWDAYSWLNAGIGDAYFFQANYALALEHFYKAANSVEATANPFINLRLGQCNLELGNQEKATGHLLNAYMVEGEEMFADDDPKYLEHLQATAEL